MSVDIRVGDALDTLCGLTPKSVQCCVTSPPYWGLRDYGHDGQIGLEKTPSEYIAKLVEVFRYVSRTLADDGTDRSNSRTALPVQTHHHEDQHK